MAESTWADPNFQAWAKKNNYVLAKGETEEFTDLKEKYNIVGTPTVMIFNAKGEQVDRTLGYVKTAEFIATVDDYQKGVGTLGTMLAAEEKSKEDAEFLYKLGERLTSWNRLDEADARYAAVVKVDPENKVGKSDDALLDRAWLCRKKETYDCAIGHAQDCYNRWPKGEMADDALVTVAWYQVKAGKKDAAKATFKEYLKQWPEGEDAEFAKEQIADLEKPAEATPGQGGGQ